MVQWVVGSILLEVDLLSYFSFKPVLHDWRNKGLTQYNRKGNVLSTSLNKTFPSFIHFIKYIGALFGSRPRWSGRSGQTRSGEVR